MSSEEEVSMEKNPDLDLANLRFVLGLPNLDAKRKEEIGAKVISTIKEKKMAPYYKSLCERFPDMKKDDSLLEELEEDNQKELTELESKLEDATENFGESEVREALLNIAEFFTRIGDQTRAESAWRVTQEKTVGSGQRLDVVFSLIRVGLFHNDMDLVSRNIDKAKSLLEEGGDWDRKNRLKVYEATYMMSIRRFEDAATLFLETISTFTSYELFSYQRFIFYTIICSIISLDRPMLKKRVIDSPEVLSVIDQVPPLSSFLNSLYDSEYAAFLIALADVCDQLRETRYLSAHQRFFCREMRIKAYAQMLESYQSVQMASMAAAFGVSTEFLDAELAPFIAAGRLHCKIDKVSGVVETNRPDSTNADYQQVIKQGDMLLTRLQKLSQVINL